MYLTASQDSCGSEQRTWTGRDHFSTKGFNKDCRAQGRLFSSVIEAKVFVGGEEYGISTPTSSRDVVSELCQEKKRDNLKNVINK